jgi:hypothetical protein
LASLSWYGINELLLLRPWLTLLQYVNEPLQQDESRTHTRNPRPSSVWYKLSCSIRIANTSHSKGLVGDPLRTVALGIPQGAFQVFWILSGTFIASKFRNCRTTVMACWLIPTIIGVTLMWKIDRKSHGVGVLFGYYLVGCYVASLVLALQMPTTNLGGYTKRITASGMVFLAYCVGNIGKYCKSQREC